MGCRQPSERLTSRERKRVTIFAQIADKREIMNTIRPLRRSFSCRSCHVARTRRGQAPRVGRACAMSRDVADSLIRMEATNLADLYHLPLLDWARLEARLAAGLGQAPGSGARTGTRAGWPRSTRTKPHVTGVGALWADGCWWFETGRSTRKGKNLARDPRCTLSVAAQEFDLVVAGAASLVTDAATVAVMARRWAAAGFARPGPTTPGRRSRPSSARPRPARRPGTCTGSPRARRRHWPPSLPAARRDGGSSAGPGNPEPGPSPGNRVVAGACEDAAGDQRFVADQSTATALTCPARLRRDG